MILRRITLHVKDQNWFAVFLDFFIVVVGILIAFQITNWNERQVSKHQAQRLLATLNTDLQAMRKHVDDLKNRSYQNSLSLHALLTQLENGEIVEKQTVDNTINNANNMYLIPEPPLSLQEMMTSGKLDLLESATLRASLREFFSRSSRNLIANTYLANEFSRSSEKLSHFFIVHRAPSLQVGRDFLPVTDVEIDALWADAKAQLALKSLYNIHVNMQFLTQTTISSIDATLDEMNGGGAQ